MKEEFKNPKKDYRPIPFWSWNEDIKPEEIKRQVREMADKGLGGYFMHARSGLMVDYLGKKWYDCIEAGIEAAGENNIDAWVYDEEGWPSGFAGGIVTSMSADYHARFMTIEEYATVEELEKAGVFCEPGQSGQNAEPKQSEETKQSTEKRKNVELNQNDQNKNMSILAVYLLRSNRTYERITLEQVAVNPAELFKVGKVLVIRRHVQQFYIDVMNKEAVDAFLEVTHQQYYDRFKEAFGKELKGFFTDEPRFTCNRFGELTWSEQLPGVMKERYGVELMDHLPCLWLELAGYEKVRYEFWCTANDLFVTHYMKNIYDWCDRHNCMATGHIMLEESIFGQMTSSGGVMPFYEYEHIPGIDWLRRRIESPVIAKQVGSVACQLGKKKVLTESFALAGWNVSFEELKWIMEWQYVNGVNMLCQHLQAYSLKGSRKRDYPPSLFDQQSWWENYNQFTDYAGRLGYILSIGNQTADVLLLHPMRSGYVSFDGSRTDRLRKLDNRFTEISCALSGEHISYHYGDETIISRHGSVSGNRFVVGEISYQTVILPLMYAIDEKTALLLIEFGKNGGTILRTDALPTFTNGDMKLLEDLNCYVRAIEKDCIRDEMQKRGLVSVSINAQGTEVHDISYQIREAKEGTILFMVNHSTEKAYMTDIRVYGCCATVEQMHAEDGTCTSLYETYDGDTNFQLDFNPRQSYLVLLTKKEKQEEIAEAAKLIDEKVTIVRLPDHWKAEQVGLNSLTLDICKYSIDDQPVLGPIATIKLMKKLLDLKKDCRFKLYYEFTISMDIANNKEFFLAMEDAEKYTVRINNQVISYVPDGTWKDRSFKRVNIKPYIKEGKNELVLEAVFHQKQKVYDVLYGEGVYETELNKLTYDMEMESVYLVGDFGVISRCPFVDAGRDAMFTEGPFEIVNQPVSFKNGSFTSQGLLFFSDAVTVSQTITVKKEAGKKVLLHYGKQYTPMMEIFVNDKLVKTALWAPYEADITEAVINGENKLTVRLYASNRNLFGPHHHINGECYNVGPSSFIGEWSWVERNSEADATDISDRTKNYWNNAYCFVKFGFEN